MVMYRYMAFTWSRTDQEARQAVSLLAEKLLEVSKHVWSQVQDDAGLAIYHSGEHKGRMQTYRLQGERGAVLGRLFRNDYTSVVEDLDEFESRKCLETRGQRLIDHYWGRYVAFLNDAVTGTRYVLRDPTGAFPCYYTEFRGVTIYFSDIEDAASFDFLPFTVNWDFLKSEIVLPQYQKTITGLNEVSEVLPAERVEITPFSNARQFIWNPTAISKLDVLEDPGEAAESLRETVMGTIGALAGSYDRVIHNLGGLDSSIALACMAEAATRPEITCVNFYTKAPQGEERYYSRQIAEKYGVDLVEQELDARKSDLAKVFYSNRIVNPLGFFDCIGLTGDLLELAEVRNAQALFYGVGGDNVFYQPARNLGALDFVRRHGLLGKDVLRVAMEASRYGGKSLFDTACDMVRERISPSACYDYVQKSFIADHNIPIANMKVIGRRGHEQLLHPLLIPGKGDFKAKYLHIFMCALFSLDYYDHWDKRYQAERVLVYLTQPIIELCLRIPVWVLTYGGVDRGLARKSFQGDLPHDLITRFSKSTPNAFYRDTYERNIDLIRDTLLDGNLTKEHILTRKDLESALNKADVSLTVTPHLILGYFAMEVWLRSWKNRPATSVESVNFAV